MKKFTCAAGFALIFFQLGGLPALAQNVGIGTTNPTQKLDVHGNINVTGSILANGVDGQPNEVLTKNQAGQLAWASLDSYKHSQLFSWAGPGVSQPFVVPPGVNKVVVELWGGGGGGNANGGGGAGGYAICFFDATPGATLFLVVGGAGNFGDGNNPGGNGTGSSVTYLSSSLGVSGGFGAGNFPGFGGGLSTVSGSGGFSYVWLPGQIGRYNTESFAQRTVGEFVQIVKYGNGGVAPRQLSLGGEGGYSIINTGTGISLVDRPGRQGADVGEGGGGGRSFGGNGGFGRVVVHW